ncbi:MAG TPA: phosphate/phosphite/phosphonate ABC transporter substrate-binding protein [Nitrospirae bacterium]|nr:phosphate-import protein PhnD precursor [bacterium BMS3Bbin08]HDK81579.1 phosphate/phosphite/phosphonate ABC transporter substrate-binding protein [Nitrospirota bacterium]
MKIKICIVTVFYMIMPGPADIAGHVSSLGDFTILNVSQVCADEGFPTDVKTQKEVVRPRVKKFRKGDKFVIVLIPEKNVFDQRNQYKHITNYLSKKLDLDVQAEILPSYGDICRAFLRGEADAGFFGGFSYIMTRNKVAIEPVARPVWLDNSSTYSGYIFVRRDSGIRTVEDMEGKSIALVHRATTAGYIFPRAYFKRHGISDMENYFSKIYFAGSHDTSAWAVYTGEADIGSCKNRIFNALAREDQDFRNQMVVLAESQEMPSNGLAVSRYLDPALKSRIKNLLLNLDKSREGRLVLKNFGAVRFIETRDEDYALQDQMIKEAGVDIETNACGYMIRGGR